MRHRSVPRHFSPIGISPIGIAIGFLLAACSGSSSGSSGDGFQLTRISLLEDAIWKVNQEIVFTFSDDLDFSTVSSNTISIQTTSGTPATGTFFLRGTNQVVFQPACPTLADLSDTGLVAGGTPYVIRVLGRSSGAANTVRSSGGTPLEVTQVRNFTTDDFGVEFIDTQGGPPEPVVRSFGSALENATYLEVGGNPDPDSRVYFERDGSNLVLSNPTFLAPLNLYAGDPGCESAARNAAKVAFVIEFNQPLHPAATNISTTRMRLEFLDGVTWRPLDTEVTLVANCTQSGGARVRLEPVGALPRNTQVRAVVLVGLEDLVREPTNATNATFAILPGTSNDPGTANPNFPGLNPQSALSDEFAESFEFGGTSPLAFQDTGVLSDAPSAAWGGGRLTAAFSFEGGGGPGGAFDWLVLNGDSIVVDTDDGAIVADDGVTVQLIDDGVVNVRHFTIEQGGEVRVQGSQPLRINATGSPSRAAVIINGTLDVSGFDAKDVSQLNTGDVVELGAAGGPGGGRGGHANEVVTNSTSRGGSGQGPLVSPFGGGQGGESGFAPLSMGKDARRPGGGAGGRFALDQGAGLSAQEGLPGSGLASGALPPNIKPPSGGQAATGPFVDGLLPQNDFFGTMALGLPGNVTELVHGELTSLWGGYGGGGGGNADPANVFPTPNWTPSSDEKGGAGGGGGGGLLIRALGPIQFGASGLIRCNGGLGAIGENVLAQDHVGGNGGSGSGGHVVLETASYIDFTEANTNTAIIAVGGEPREGTPTSAGDVSFGGRGGPGVIQLHVPGPLRPPSTSSAASGIVLSASAGTDVDAVTTPRANVMVPAFASLSQARSEWISIGSSDRLPGGALSQLQFFFQGINTVAGADEGKILVSDEDGDLDADEVQPLAPLLDEDLEGNQDVHVLADRLTLRIDGATGRFPGANDIYLRNPALLAQFVLRLSVRLSVPAVFQDFVVASACYDGAELLDVTVSDEAGDLQDFINANTAPGTTIHYELIPRFFRVVTGGVEGSLPSTAFVRIRFQAAADDGSGSPDEANPLVDWTGDISQFNALLPGELQFFRFDVEFDLGAPVSADTQPISLDFLRIPFVF